MHVLLIINALAVKRDLLVGPLAANPADRAVRPARIYARRDIPAQRRWPCRVTGYGYSGAVNY